MQPTKESGEKDLGLFGKVFGLNGVCFWLVGLFLFAFGSMFCNHLFVACVLWVLVVLEGELWRWLLSIVVVVVVQQQQRRE